MTHIDKGKIKRAHDHGFRLRDIVALYGYTPEQVRSVIGKKRNRTKADVRARAIDGLIAEGHSPEVIAKVFGG